MKTILRRSICFVMDYWVLSIISNLFYNVFCTAYAKVDLTAINTLEVTSEVKAQEFISQMGNTNLFLLYTGGILIGLLYLVIIPMFVFKGQTLAMKLVKIKAVALDGSGLTLQQLAMRFLVGFFILQIGATPTIDFATSFVYVFLDSAFLANILVYTLLIAVSSSVLILITKQHRGFQDIISKSQMIYINEKPAAADPNIIDV